MADLLQGKIALITGAGSGMGKATAECFAREGACVGLVDVDDAALAETYNDVVAIGAKAHAAVADVRSMEQVNAAVGEIVAALGPIDILLNAAGLRMNRRLEDVTEAEWDLAYDVNVKGTMLVSKAVTPAMVERKQGCVINIASLAGLSRGFPGNTPYGSSKYAVVGFSRYLATELRPDNVKVTCLCPGSTNTHFRGDVTSDNWINAEDIADVVLFVASRQGHMWIAEMSFSSIKEMW